LSTLISFTAPVTLSITCVSKALLLYCDVIIKSHLQLINTSINTFFSKLRAFLANKEDSEEGRPMIVKRKLDGTVNESPVDQEIRKSDAIVHNL